tara:strand:+ start:73 stop:3987 length:3915 start_codon:yes stop_codon:yes gene_type:complete
MSNKLNPTIPLNSIQYFSNARGVNYLPSLDTEWKNSGYLPRVMLNETTTAATLAGAGNPGYDWYYSNDPVQGFKYFSGANRASIWHYYNEEDHKSSLRKIRDLGINCIRVPLCFYAWTQFGDDYLAKVKSFLGVCEEEKVRVQFTVWNGELNLASVYSPEGVLHPEPTALNTDASASFATSLAVASLREPNPLQAENATFFTASAIPYLDALANSVKDYQSMWAFDLCNKPTSQYLSLCASSYTRLNTSLSSTNIKYTFTPLNGVQVYEDTNYLDNGKGTGPSGSFYNSDIRTLSGSIDFISIPFVANNAYATNRYLAAAASGSSVLSLYKPFMVYDTYDPTKLQNLDTTLGVLAGSSVGYFSNMGIVDSPFSIGNSVSPNSNVYSDGEYRDSSDASSVLLQAKDTNWFGRTQLKSANLITQKGADPLNVSGGYYYGTDVIGGFNNDLYVSADETKWTDQKWYYVNRPEQSLARRSQSSNTYLGSKGGVYADSLVYQLEGASSLSVNSLEANLGILYDFDTYFPKISSYPFSLDGANWEAINATMIYRNEFLQLLAKYVIDYSEVPYAELRNSVYDTNPIPHYEREELLELIELMSYSRLIDRNPTTNTKSTVNPPTLTGTATYANSKAVYGVADSGTDFAAYYDTYYSNAVTQLKKCLMWLYWKGDSDPAFKIVSDSFLAGIEFSPSSLSSVEVYPSSIVDSTASSLSSVTSPLYSVAVYDPALEAWVDSFVFVASALPRQLTAYQIAGDLSALWGLNGDHQPISFTTFGTSGMAAVKVTSLQGPIASCYTFPERFSKKRNPTITPDNEVVVDLFIGDKIWLEFDGNVSAPLFIFADPFKPPIPSGAQTYQGQNRNSYVDTSRYALRDLSITLEGYSSVAADGWYPGQTPFFSSLMGDTYFGPGKHYIGMGVPIAPSTTIYIDANAYVIGGFDSLYSSGTSRVIGRGVMSSELYSRPYIVSIKNEIAGSTWVGNMYTSFGIGVSSFTPFYQNPLIENGFPLVKVEGLTMTNAAYHNNGRVAVQEFNHCKVLSPWAYNADGFKVYARYEGGLGSVKNALAICGDDNLTPVQQQWWTPASMRNIVLGNMRGSPIVNYFTTNPNYAVDVKDIDIYCYAFSGNNLTTTQPNPISFSNNSLFTLLLDSSSGSSNPVGMANVSFKDIHVQGGYGGSYPIYQNLFQIGNRKYIYSDSNAVYRDAFGMTSGITFTNVNIVPSAYVPITLHDHAAIFGLSSVGAAPAQPTNRPTDIVFTNFKLGTYAAGEEFLTDINRDDWVKWFEPLSATVSVTDPDSTLGADSGIIFKTT